MQAIIKFKHIIKKVVKFFTLTELEELGIKVLTGEITPAEYLLEVELIRKEDERNSKKNKVLVNNA